ncbi:tail fiber protein [Escherichia coli O128:H2 str. 2011C-3317]|nr:putative tail fiber protein [Escherichia coli DEC8C]EKH58974.1 putative tail fiber protein [Escherichia coli FRIK2001]KDV60071.1 tail fiber protein [Escherichia coli O128:H2 str. 2011C-3317]
MFKAFEEVQGQRLECNIIFLKFLTDAYLQGLMSLVMVMQR